MNGAAGCHGSVHRDVPALGRQEDVETAVPREPVTGGKGYAVGSVDRPATSAFNGAEAASPTVRRGAVSVLARAARRRRGMGRQGSLGRSGGNTRRFMSGAVGVLGCAVIAGACGHTQPNAIRSTTSSPASTTPPRSTVPTTSAPSTSSSSLPSTTSTPTTGSTPPASVTPTSSKSKPSTPPTATPHPLSPSVTAGTAVPWSPTSPDSLVGDSGNPADWPAAQPKPPSLAGAYGTNMIKVIVTLITYEDWVWSHPNPALVANYMIAGGNAYKSELASVTSLARKGWHADPSPSEIDWIAISVPAKPLRLIDGKVARVNGRQAYMPATVDIVLNQKAGEYLDNKQRVVGHSAGGGRKPFAVTLTQGSDARWRIIDIYRLRPAGGLSGLKV